MRILIMGLPGSGKTTLARELFNLLSDEEGSCSWANADWVRSKYNDWDFSPEGRIRQAHRMRELADSSTNAYFIADFVSPLPEMRDIFDADYTVWMDTIQEGRFEDTNKAFIPPEKYDIRITEMDAKKWAYAIVDLIDVINR